MQLTNRVKRNPASQTSAEEPAKSEAPTAGGAEPPASFDDWLDGRLKNLYQAVLNEPLPSEITTLLGAPPQKKSDGSM